MTQDSKIAAECKNAKAEQERSRNRRAEQAEAIRSRTKLEDSLNDSAKTLLASAEAERQEEGLRVIRDGLAADVENLILEIKRNVDIARKQKRLSQKADRLAQDVMTFASAFAGRKRMLEEVETKLGLLRKVTAEGAEHAGGKQALSDLPEGCKDLQKQIAELTQARWDALVAELERRAIKPSTFTEGATPKDNFYGRQGIFEHAKDPQGQDIHHDVMKFLEESGIFLLCHVTSDAFNQMLKDTHPEGHDPCAQAQITTKIPF